MFRCFRHSLPLAALWSVLFSVSAAASLTPQGPTSIVTGVYRNPLALPVLGTRAYLPIAWVAATGRTDRNPRGLAMGREAAASNTFDDATRVSTVGVNFSGGTLAPGAFDAFRLQTRGYFDVDFISYLLETADGPVPIDEHAPDVLSNLLSQSFLKRDPIVDLSHAPVYSVGRPMNAAPPDVEYELELSDLELRFGLPIARFTLDDFLTNLPAPDYSEALLTLPADARFEIAASGRYSRSTYSLATISNVRVRNVVTQESIEFGPVAFAQTVRAIPEPPTPALLGMGLAVGLFGRFLSARSVAAARSNRASPARRPPG